MKLFLQNGNVYEGTSFGADREADGEVVFTTGMTGYLEVLTDPSYYGQIVVFTYPLIGNYGVFDPAQFAQSADKKDTVDTTYESKKIWVKGVILSEHAEKYSHELAQKSFSQWLRDQDIPAMSGIDTRALTQVLRETGTILGRLGNTTPSHYRDPLEGRFVPEVSPTEISIFEPENPIGKTIAFIDCGAKDGILRNFLRRGVKVLRCPFDMDPFELDEKFDGIFISNGPGDPATCHETIETTRKAVEKKVPTFGICLGNQILALATGGQTRKMKYGHRGVNQPVQDQESKKCIITTQNHGFEVNAESLSNDWQVWFTNLNDQSVEGIKHNILPFSSVQFHPEACAGPEDAQYLFDRFIEQL